MIHTADGRLLISALKLVVAHLAPSSVTPTGLERGGKSFMGRLKSANYVVPKDDNQQRAYSGEYIVDKLSDH